MVIVDKTEDWKFKEEISYLGFWKHFNSFIQKTSTKCLMCTLHGHKGKATKKTAPALRFSV